jgi:hypothetical protein
MPDMADDDLRELTRGQADELLSELHRAAAREQVGGDV